jgi:hypothetical protein
MDMKCDDLLKALNEYVDGTLDSSVCEMFQSHLKDCKTCRIVVDNVRKTIQLYRGDTPCELPAEIQSRLHACLKDRWRQRQS